MSQANKCLRLRKASWRGGEILFCVKQSQINGIYGCVWYDRVILFVKRRWKCVVVIFLTEAIINSFGTQNDGLPKFVIF